MQTTYHQRKSLHALFVGFALLALKLSGAAPAITAVENNYSYFIPGTPSYAIAPGALFILKGTGMAAAGTQPQLWNLSQGPLPLTSPAANGTSVSVTVGTTNVNCGIYYVSPTQVAAVLPSTTPTGSATFTVTYNGQSGSISNIAIGASAMGFDTLYGSAYGIGVGEGVATDNTTGNLITYAASASWNEVVVLWGSGLGGDTANDDRSFPPIRTISAIFPHCTWEAYRRRSSIKGAPSIPAWIKSTSSSPRE